MIRFVFAVLLCALSTGPAMADLMVVETDIAPGLTVSVTSTGYNDGVDFDDSLALSSHATDELGALGLYQDYLVHMPVPAAVPLGMSVGAARLRKFT